MNAYHMTGYANQYLVKNGGEEEYDECSHRLRKAHPDGGEIDVSNEPVVDGHIPQTPICANLGGIPPISVENFN